ncbi:MAG TPA: MliC family protein [Syntrophales bacterium]|nr:MliC family protein [Syntrophales bacterium]
MKRERTRHSRGYSPALIFLAAAALVLTAGCAPRIGYVCDNGKTLVVTFHDRQHKIDVDTGTGTFYLRSVPASSGARYADEERVFWFKGDDLSVTVNDRPVYGQCRKEEGSSR